MTKEEKSSVRKEPNFVQRYWQETVGELRKVNWPSRKEATNLTIVVLVTMLVTSLYLGLLDALFSYIFKLILG